MHRSRRKKVSEMSHLEKAGRLFRRGSNASQDSQQGGTQILSALMVGGASNLALPMPNMKRRSAIGDGWDEQILIAKMLDERGNRGLLYNCDSDENLSSEEKDTKDVDVEAGNLEKENSDDEESEPEEETKMLPMPDEEERLTKYSACTTMRKRRRSLWHALSS